MSDWLTYFTESFLQQEVYVNVNYFFWIIKFLHFLKFWMKKRSFDYLSVKLLSNLRLLKQKVTIQKNCNNPIKIVRHLGCHVVHWLEWAPCTQRLQSSTRPTRVLFLSSSAAYLHPFLSAPFPLDYCELKVTSDKKNA